MKQSWNDLLERAERAEALAAKYRDKLLIAEERIDELETPKRNWFERIINYGKKYWKQ